MLAVPGDGWDMKMWAGYRNQSSLCQTEIAVAQNSIGQFKDGLIYSAQSEAMASPPFVPFAASDSLVRWSGAFTCARARARLLSVHITVHHGAEDLSDQANV